MTTGPVGPTGTRTTRQRRECGASARDRVLPAFMNRDGEEWRLVRDEANILSRVPWERVDLARLGDLALGEGIGGDLEPPRRSDGRGAGRRCRRSGDPGWADRRRSGRLLLRGQPPARPSGQSVAGPGA